MVLVGKGGGGGGGGQRGMLNRFYMRVILALDSCVVYKHTCHSVSMRTSDPSMYQNSKYNQD